MSGSHHPAGPLVGVRVLELGSYIAGPFACRLLGDFGAEVIKVERPGVGDELRRWRLHDGDTSMLWRVMARNKKSVTIDIGTTRGRDLILEMVERCDVMVENFRPGTMERLGLGEETLRQHNPDLVLVRISGYGQTGPYAGRAGFGGVAEAYGGLRNLTGYPDLPPTRTGVALGDALAGLHAALGAVMSLFAKERRGEPPRGGELVDVALHESVFNIMESLVPDFDAFKILPERSGSTLPGVAPSGTYQSAEEDWVVIGGNGDRIFPKLMRIVGRQDLAENAGRVARQKEIEDAIAEWVSTQSTESVLRQMEGAGVPAGPILTAQGILDDAQYQARGMIDRRPVRVGETERQIAFPGVVPRLRDHPGAVDWLGPELGEHTFTVLTELLDVDERSFRELQQEGVV